MARNLSYQFGILASDSSVERRDVLECIPESQDENEVS
jgi:hypothetical protein